MLHLSLDSFTLSVAAEAQSFAVVGSAVGSLQLDSCLVVLQACFFSYFRGNHHAKVLVRSNFYVLLILSPEH